MNPLQAQYQALQQGHGFAILPKRCLLELTGQDRQKFLHNFCTADVKGLHPGQVTEAFVLNDKGKVLSFGQLIALEDRLLYSSAGDEAQQLLEHLDKYLLREDVQLTDRSTTSIEFFVCGNVNSNLQTLASGLPAINQAITARLAGSDCVIANCEVAGHGYLFVTALENQADLANSLEQAGLQPVSMDVLHQIRIEQQTPWFGVDIDESNLPQELHRDEKAISFTKGCYLGQETVARIDARGHVNKLLVGLQFESAADPAPGLELIHEGKSVGRVTSAIRSAVSGKHIGLGYVRRALSKPATVLESECGKVVVVG